MYTNLKQTHKVKTCLWDIISSSGSNGFLYFLNFNGLIYNMITVGVTYFTMGDNIYCSSRFNPTLTHFANCFHEHPILVFINRRCLAAWAYRSLKYTPLKYIPWLRCIGFKSSLDNHSITFNNGSIVLIQSRRVLHIDEHHFICLHAVSMNQKKTKHRDF